MAARSSSGLLNHKIVGKAGGNVRSTAMIMHGLFGSSNNWASVTSEMESRKMFDQVVLVDLRNHGKSFHDSNFTLDAMADDVTRLVDHLDLPEDFTLLGHSLGGKVAMQMALKGMIAEPSNLVIVDIAPITYNSRGAFDEIVTSMMKLDTSKGKKRGDIEKDFKELLPKEDPMVRSFLLSNLEPKGQEWRWRVNLDAIYQSLEEVGSKPESLDGKKSNMRTLFIGGENSSYIPKEAKEPIIAHFPNSDITYVKAGHWLHYENPKAFLNVLEDFRNQRK